MVSEFIRTSQKQFVDVEARMALLERFATSLEKGAAAPAAAAAQEQGEQTPQKPQEVVGLPASRSRPSTPRGAVLTPRGGAATTPREGRLATPREILATPREGLATPRETATPGSSVADGTPRTLPDGNGAIPPCPLSV